MALSPIACLWHFHQPLYREPQTGRAAMPWVRLHATKGYTDLVALLEEYPHVSTTINAVPSLLDQLETYEHGTVTDPLLELMRAPADGLTAAQAADVLHHGFQVNWHVRVDPHVRYRTLLEKRGRENGRVAESVLKGFTAQDLRDVQVWNALAWMGFTLRQHDPVVRELLAKGKEFSEEDQAAVYAVQLRAAAEVVPRLKAAQDRGQLELTCSPHYHPILPLLINTDFTLRALPEATVAYPPFVAWEDAREQLQMAVRSHERRFGRRPRGCWPSEGAVCPELIPLLADAGFDYAVADEGVLHQSTLASDGRVGTSAPYQAPHAHGHLTLVFRDRELSDLIGFTYQGTAGADAAADFLYRADQRAQRAVRRPALIAVALDGENPWEYYPDSGEGFLRSVYEGIEDHPRLRMTTMSEAVDLVEHGPVITHLHSGSWIYACYGIWGDGREEAVAWDLLRRTREFLLDYERTHPDLDPEVRRNAWRNIYAAEGSDWFWWYGDDFTSENDPEFDRLFRLHLQAVYTELGVEVPAELTRPVVAAEYRPFPL